MNKEELDQKKQKAIEDIVGFQKGDTVYIVNRDPNTLKFSVSCDTVDEVKAFIRIDVGKKYYSFLIPFEDCFKTEEEAKEIIKQFEEKENNDK